MPTLKEVVAQGVDFLFAERNCPWVKTIQYNDKNIPAVVEFKEDLDQKTNARMAAAKIIVRTSDVSQPDYRQKVIINNEIWRVQNIISGDGYVWELNLYNDERPLW